MVSVAPTKTLTAVNVPLLCAHAMVEAVQSNVTVLSPMPFGVRCNAAGTLKIRDSRGNTVAMTVAAGEVILCRLDMVYDTDTSLADADIHLLY